MQYEYDENAFPKYIMGEAMSIGENYDAARMQAIELAKLNLASQIQTEVTALIESSVANKQLAQDEAASLTETVAASKNLISQRIGRVIPTVECYRVKSNKNKEVLIQLAYNSKWLLRLPSPRFVSNWKRKETNCTRNLMRSWAFRLDTRYCVQDVLYSVFCTNASAYIACTKSADRLRRVYILCAQKHLVRSCGTNRHQASSNQGACRAIRNSHPVYHNYCY